MDVLIDRVANCASTDIRFKNQSRDEPELSLDDKRQIVADLLTKSPAQFLFRFGPALEPPDLVYFEQFSVDPAVQIHLHDLREHFDTKHQKLLTKNRRFAALPRLQAAGYFDEAEMQKRDPLLYEELVEKYLNPEEKRAREKARKSTGTDHPFADILMESLIETPRTEEFLVRQKEYEAHQTEETDSDEEEEEAVPEDPLDDREKEVLREEFRHIMEERFLEGRDGDYVDYAQIDRDERLDVAVRELWRDEEDRYFDEEEPSDTIENGVEKLRIGEDKDDDLDY
ncbi:coiled-coil domain-containing protein 97-like [Paramacrobiotus metropolitanus]|uniref:coiled-coil domain-containing protein 97-like n=1 Tax=Paramacrobiotus metropolitanus TaxID=2943436 RepID=UPI002445ADEE|nr:coiled-coil domain-containing protein 97-like [Paramacrobiotus metropolitanus]